MFATVGTVEETNSALKASTETSGNETARSQSLFALHETLKNAKTLAKNLESLTNIIHSCTEETSGIETNSCRSLSLVTKGENKLDFESINRCLELLINEFLTTTETNRIETTGHNSTFCKETNENEMNYCEDLGLITNEMNNIGEENLNAVLNFLKTTLQTSGNEAAKGLISQELNKEKYNGLQALQITVKETSGIETPRYLMQLIAELNKTENVSADKVATSKKSDGNETPQSLKNQYLIKSRLKRNLPYICNKIETYSQIPKEIIKIPKKYLTYRRAQNAENSFINKESGNEEMARPGDNVEKETRVDKNSRLKLKIPVRCLHNLKNFVNPKRCMNDEKQQGRYEMKHFKPVADILDKVVNKRLPHLREGAKNKQEFCRKLLGESGPKQINVKQYGGGKKYPCEVDVNFTIIESKNERESGENSGQLSNREKEEDKREERITARKRNVDILKEKREDEIKEKEKKCENNEGEKAVQKSEIIGKKDLEKQKVMPKGSEYSNVEKIPKKKYSFRRSLRNCFGKEEKTNDTDAKNTEEDCAVQENNLDDRCEIDRMAEHFTQMFHI